MGVVGVSQMTLRGGTCVFCFVLAVLLLLSGEAMLSLARGEPPRAPGPDEPALPAGPGDAEPRTPEGPASDEEPAPPPGPAGAAEEPPPPAGPQEIKRRPGSPIPDKRKPPAKWLDLTGFWEVRGGIRTQRDSHEKTASLGETRLHLDWEKPWQKLILKVSADFVYDPVLDHHSVNLQSGQGWVDLRQANVTLSPAKFMDVKVGRQILTWGTGDLLFLNDLFPKDWQAFFVGRDEEYLKAPSDALKMSLFSDLADMDIVYVPQFDHDRFIRGRRISYYNAALGRLAGRDAVVDADEPSDWFRNDEWAARVSKNLKGYELAAYGFWGYWKSPGGQAPITGNATFPRLAVYGASARGQVGKGIGNVEAAYYNSHQDDDGDAPFTHNSQLRILFGYEQDLPQIARDLVVGVQYYVEWMADYDDYLRMVPMRARAADERRHVITSRITKRLMNQNMTLSLFAYYSPSDADAYLRANVKYKIDDNWTAEVGGNVFLGKYAHTFFGQFDRNSNLYAALRYAF